MATPKQQDETAVANVIASDYIPARTRNPEDDNWMEVIRDNIGDDTVDRFALNRLRVPPGGGTAWEVADIYGATEMVPEFRGIIIHWAPNRMYWPEAFTGEGVPPSCTSTDGRTGIGNPGGECRPCPLNAYGTAEKGNGKACKEVRATFVLAPDSVFPFYLSAPPTSLKNFKNFMVGLAGKGIAYWQCEVGFKLESVPGQFGKYSKVTARVLRMLEPNEIENIAKYRNEIRPALDENVIVDVYSQED